MSPQVPAARSSMKTRWARNGFAFATWSAIWFALTFDQAAHRRLWNDELFTTLLCRLPHVRDIWTSLATSAPDHNPPGIYVLTRASIAMWGDSALAMRLLPVLAFWLMSLVVFVLVARRTNALCGICAVMFASPSGART